MSYRVEIRPAARRTIARLEAGLQRRVIAALEALGVQPRPPGSKRLQGTLRHLHRIRVGDLRVLYAIRDAELLVLVVEVGDRRDVYR